MWAAEWSGRRCLPDGLRVGSSGLVGREGGIGLVTAGESAYLLDGPHLPFSALQVGLLEPDGARRSFEPRCEHQGSFPGGRGNSVVIQPRDHRSRFRVSVDVLRSTRSQELLAILTVASVSSLSFRCRQIASKGSNRSSPDPDATGRVAGVLNAVSLELSSQAGAEWIRSCRLRVQCDTGLKEVVRRERADQCRHARLRSCSNGYRMSGSTGTGLARADLSSGRVCAGREHQEVREGHSQGQVPAAADLGLLVLIAWALPRPPLPRPSHPAILCCRRSVLRKEVRQ